ncbi:MAG: Phaeocystis globosa virus, partial [Bacteroidota bacterium]
MSHNSSKSDSASSELELSSEPINSESLKMGLLYPETDVSLDSKTEDHDILNDRYAQIKNLLETRNKNLKHLENVLPSKYTTYDPSCIRKFSNFSFPKNYKLFYDFVDYYPSKKECEDRDITSATGVEKYLRKIHNQNMYNDFIDTLKLVSPKTLTLLDKIQELDEKDMAQYGRKFKHFIFSDSKTSMAGVKLLASALIASGMKLGYTAKPKYGKKNWDKMELLSDAQLRKSKYNNFYMLCSKTVYDEPISVATKKEILGRFNARPDNVYGENIRIILMDGGYKEGIDLFDIKYVHIFEPTLTQADQKQVVGRGTRTCGQKGLDFHPVKGWPLYVYVYDLKMEEPFNKSLGADSGIEMYFKAKNLNVKLLNFMNELETVCIQNAVDYELNKHIHSFSISFNADGDSMRGGDSSSSSSRSKSSSHSSSSSSRSMSNSDSSRSRSKSSSHSDSSVTSEVVSSRSNTPSLNEEFFKNSLSSSSSKSKSKSPEDKLSFVVDKPLNAAEMREYIREYFSRYAWDPVVMENNCVPKGGAARKQMGGATIMNYTPTQAFVSNFFTPQNPLKGMLLWHSVGTGKTCTAIATATSSFEKQGYTILWVTRTTLKNDIWKNMFDQVCHEIIKLKIENQGIVIPSNNTDRMKLLSKSWRIRPMSYKQFSNLVSKKNQIYETMVKINGKEDPLRKTLLIIDEAHKLYGGGDLSTIETPDMVSLHASLMNSYIMSGSESVKLLLMTATPVQTDPMELIKLINLFKLPNEQIPDNFELFSEKYLNENGIFKPDGLHKFRNEIAGHISYLNREKDARQFSQPVISIIKTNVYDKEILNYNKKLTRKLYSVMSKDINNKLKSLKANPILTAKTPEAFNSIKKIC